MKNWIKHIVEVLSPNKWDTNNPIRDELNKVGYRDNYYVKNNLWSNSGDFDLLKAQFYTKEKEGPVELLKDQLFSKKFQVENARLKLQEAQKRASKMLELCGIIETDIDILQDEIDEIELLIAKNYPNESR